MSYYFALSHQKFFLLLLLLTIILPTKSQNCNQNPFYSNFYNFFSSLKNLDPTIYTQINEYQTFSSSSQQNQFCTQTKAASCCSTKFEETLQELANKYFYEKSQNYYFFDLFLQQYYNSLVTCTGDNSIKAPQDAEVASMLFAVKKYRQLILKIIRADVQLIRGNLCILCASSSNYDDYITDDNKILVQESDIEDFISDMASYYSDLENLRTTFKTAILDFYNSIDNIQAENCLFVYEEALDFLENYQLCSGGNCEAHVQSRVDIFNQPFEQELQNIVIPDLTVTYRRQLNEQKYINNDNKSNILQNNQQKKSLQKGQNRKNTTYFIQNETYQYKKNQIRQLSLSGQYDTSGDFNTYIYKSEDDELVYLGVNDDEDGFQKILRMNYYALFQLMFTSFSVLII
ncbi:hypothetical protein PPERSA_00946 [Pseudocohnilembus persalinus]|uniref:Transmembrane protein n=1 Tax=Pseudocohnilembus persalinus TaxID=266149 RepID=A0A0V0R990_PSEPJ|nr:hypothetical protein PPERSA_00946 [Pseudocohnilembus persalinus]|eukprot:KRX10776.1 hypothetical protein PPERSA_00946 [Pseudocohnilembus persalinus]